MFFKHQTHRVRGSGGAKHGQLAQTLGGFGALVPQTTAEPQGPPDWRVCLQTARVELGPSESAARSETGLGLPDSPSDRRQKTEARNAEQGMRS